MKRIYNSCLFILTLFLFAEKVNAQAFTFSIVPLTQCYNSSGTYTADAGIFVNVPLATSYSWTIQSPTPTCAATFTAGQHGALTPAANGSQVALTFPCCGIYTITSFAFNNTVSTVPVLITSASATTEIFCQNSGSVIVSNSVVCIGTQVIYTGTGGGGPNTYTWSNGTVGNPVIITPTVNTCLTYTTSTPQGCTLSPAPGCTSVQAVSLAVSPTSQTICANSPICLSATATAINNASTTPGTATTAIQWFSPLGAAVNGCTTTALNGVYSVSLTHVGTAGSCTYGATSTVVTSNSISVLASASAPSVCPGATVQLLGTSVQTAGVSYTWTIPNPSGPVITQTGNPIVVNNLTSPTLTSLTYTVDVDYFGCPGIDSVTVGMLTITPTLTPNSFSVCANTQLTLTATGGSLYTFNYWGTNLLSGTVIGTPSTNVNVTVHTPTVPPFSVPQYYSVDSYSNGCVGSTTIAITERTLVPTLSASSPSVCPGTQFTLTTTGVGAGATYTYVAPYNPDLGSNTSTVTHTPPILNPIPHTYTVHVDSAGCIGSAQVLVSELVLTPTLIPSSYSICPGTPISFTTTSSFDTQDSLFGPIVAPPGSTLIANATAGMAGSVFNHTAVINPALPHVYTLHSDSAGCKGVATVTIGLLNLGPLIQVTPSSASICPNTQVTFTATTLSGPGSFSYTFIAPGPTTLALTSSTTSAHSPTALGLGQTYTVMADSSSCAGQATVTIFEKVLNPILVASNNPICKGTAVTLSATNVGFGPTVTYTFGTLAPNIGPIPSGGPTFSFTTDNPTIQTVYSVIVDSAGCRANPLFPPTVTVSMLPDLVLTPGGTAASVCPGTAATLNVTGPPTVTVPITYTWTQTAGTGSLFPGVTPDTYSAVVHPITNSTYSVFALDSLGCIGSAVISVGVDPTISFPVALSSSGSTICAGQSVTLAASSTITTIGTPPLTYTWSPALGSQTPLNTSTLVVGPAISTVYSVVVSNQYGCVSGNTILVPVGNYPVPSIVASANAVCVNFTSTLTAFGANSYTWTGIGIGPPTVTVGPIAQQSISVGAGTYTVLMSNGGGCTNTATIPINTLTPIEINITASSMTTCIESNTPKFSKPVKLTASGAASYVWFPYNPNNMTYSLGATTDVRPPTSTCYTVIGSNAVCANQKTICITVIPQFTMNVVPPLPAMCKGDSIKLSILGIGPPANVVGPESAYTYSWTEAANAPPISLSNILTRTVMAFPQNTTTYSVEVRDARKCISIPRLVTVTVLPTPMTSIAIPTINSVATNSVCYVGLNPGALDVTINLIAVNGNTNLQFGVVPTYSWLAPYGPGYNSILTPSNAPGIIVNAPAKAPSVAVYTVISGYNGVPGCKRMDTVSVRVLDCRPVRNVVFTTTEVNDTICARNCITFTNLTDTMAGGPQKVEWTFEGGSPRKSTEKIPTVCYNLPGSHNVILKVSNPYPILDGGSELTMGQLGFIKVVDVPNVTIVAPGQLRSDTTIRFGTSVRLNGSGALTYEWSPNYNISSLVNPSVTVNPFKTVQYILTGYNSKNCFSSDTLDVIVIEDCGEMYVPNAFSPNGDGANDVLYVRGICLESLTFMVFNRWGEKVFETNDQSLGWDGTYKGQEMNTGVFVYRLEGKTFDGKGFSLKGNVTLLR